MAYNRPTNLNNDKITHQNILKQCTICNEAISKSTPSDSSIPVEDSDEANQNVMCTDCIEYFSKPSKSSPKNER